MTGRIAPVVLAALLGVACAVLVACGGKTDHLIPADSASSIERQLAAVQSQFDQGQCVAVDGDVTRLTQAVDRLPSSVDADLRERLDRGVRNLAQIAPAQCLAQDTVTQTTPAVTTDTSTTVEPPPTTETTPEPPITEPTTPEPPPETTTTETREDTLPTPPSGDDDTGGAIAP